MHDVDEQEGAVRWFVLNAEADVEDGLTESSEPT